MSVINVRSISDWRLLSVGQNLDMPGGKRPVTLSLMSSEPGRVTVTDLTTGQSVCIGAVNGLETYKFAVDGHCQVSVDTDSDVYFRTDDGAVTSVAYDNEAFVTMMERTPRNPQMEYMMYVQEQNAKRREVQMMEAFEARMERQARSENNSGAAGGDSSAAVAGADADPSGGAAVAKPAGAAPAGDAGKQEPAAGVVGDPK